MIFPSARQEGLLSVLCLFGKPSVVPCCALSSASALAVFFKLAFFSSLTLLASVAVAESSPGQELLRQHSRKGDRFEWHLLNLPWMSIFPDFLALRLAGSGQQWIGFLPSLYCSRLHSA